MPPAFSTDPKINKIVDPIYKELSKMDSSKLPKTMGLDFFAPYVKKYDTENKFKDLFSLHPSIDTMKLKTALITTLGEIRKTKSKVK